MLLQLLLMAETLKNNQHCQLCLVHWIKLYCTKLFITEECTIQTDLQVHQHGPQGWPAMWMHHLELSPTPALWLNEETHFSTTTASLAGEPLPPTDLKRQSQSTVNPILCNVGDQLSLSAYIKSTMFHPEQSAVLLADVNKQPTCLELRQLGLTV